MAALQQPHRQRQLSQNEQQRLLQLTDDAKRMRERIQALEAILDAEHPNWRDK
jgi:phage shock protein B